jgi:ABC-2 type transport system ATP-binding protein
MIDIKGLTRTYGDKTVVDDLTFTVQPGVVTGFLGPNGAGKSTTMRMLLGLERPDAGSATVNGRDYRTLPAPAHEIGVLLDAGARHPGRSARDHLLSLAATHRISSRRVDEVLELVGLSDVARKRSGAFSLGMGQRLGIASALLGDPATVMLDEPVNGLDPEGIRWIRELLRSLADEGRTVFVSSHLMSEMALTAEHLIVIGRGRLLADLTVDELVARSATSVRVRTPQLADLGAALLQDGVGVTPTEDGGLEVTGLTLQEIGDRAFDARVRVHELTLHQASLEQAYMQLTAHAVEYHGGTTTPTTGTTAPTESRAA